MNKYFTIGEISKLFNVPVKTLRYYDEIGLLKPASMNEETKYRYYSIDQFIMIDIIKNSKLMDLSLKEIKRNIDSQTSIVDTVSMIENQINIFDSKIDNLIKLKRSMEKLKSNITDALAEKHNEVFVVFNKKRRYISYDYISNNIEEQEVNLRRAIIDVERKQREVYSIFGLGSFYKDYVTEGKIINKDIRYYTNQEYENINYQTLPEGEYVTIIFDDNSYNKVKYYEKLMDYMKENNINVVGDFSETWILPRLDHNKESTLIKLDIMCKQDTM